MINWRFLWFAISLGILTGGYLAMYITFLYAYFFNDMIFAITINSLGEADFEFWFFGICTIFSALGIWQYFRFKKEER